MQTVLYTHYAEGDHFYNFHLSDNIFVSTQKKHHLINLF